MCDPFQAVAEMRAKIKEREKYNAALRVEIERQKVSRSMPTACSAVWKDLRKSYRWNVGRFGNEK